MKIAFIGNCNVIAIRRAWNDEVRSHEPAYFAAHGAGFDDLVASNGVLKATSPTIRDLFLRSSGREFLDPAGYDVFVLVALALSMVRIMQIYNSHRLLEHAGPRHHYISEFTLRAAIQARVDGSLMAETIDKVQSVTGKPIYVVPSPLPSINVTTEESTKETWGDPFVPFLHQIYMDSIRKMVAAKGVFLAPQPEATLATPCFTAAEFAHYVDANHDRGYGLFHVNPLYGREVLRELLPLIDRTQDRRGVAAGVAEHAVA